MANNRYYIQCPVCKSESYLGKSLGQGIYNTRGYQAKDEVYPSKWQRFLIKLGIIRPRFLPNKKEWMSGDALVLEQNYDFMWKHMMECHQNEFKSGELFIIKGE